MGRLIHARLDRRRGRVMNLDAMTRAELLTVMYDLTVPLQLRIYAKYKQRAMLHRAEGRIKNAIDAECECGRIYAYLPEDLKW